MDWSTIYEHADAPDFNRLVRRPDEWQVALALKIRDLVGTGSVLEAGCGYGLTSLLVGPGAERTLLDLEPRAIQVASGLFSASGQGARFEVGNLFGMPFADKTFDVVFNAGVLEHFDLAGRKAALVEMARVTKRGGHICVAVPNHYSAPYREAYEYRQARNEWPFPNEDKIYDLAAELAAATDCAQVARETVAPRSSLFYLPWHRKVWYKLRSPLKGFEGYLTIITIAKAGPRAGDS